MKVEKQVVIHVPAGAWTLKPDWPERAISSLETLEYADPEKREGCVKAARGVLMPGRILPCDGRRRRHAVEVNTESVLYTIDTRFCLFTDADEAVFIAEARALLDCLAGAPLNLTELVAAEEKRASDDRNLIIVIAIIGAALVAAIGYFLF